MKPITIAVVDDDPDIIEFLQLLLRLEGLHVITCDHSPSTIDIIRDSTPDLILLDLQTPNDHRAGLTILQQLRSDPATNMIPVLLMTGDHDALNQHKSKLHELQATALKKPIDIEHLINIVKQIS